MRNYTRVIPRDLFNEAGLLKSLGRLAIALGELDGHNARIVEDTLDEFAIAQDPADGSISAENITFMIGSDQWKLFRSLNSRESYGLYASFDDEEVSVFEEDGALTDEFLELIRKS